MDESPPADKPAAFEWFELCTALLLGFGALGAALAGYEGGLWNGKCSESFAKSSAQLTLASGDDHKAMMVSMHDTEIDLEAKKLMAEATLVSDERLREASLKMVSALYLRHLSADAYASLQLPAGLRNDAKAMLPVEELMKAQDRDLDDDYMQHVFAAVEKDHEKARQEFEIGSHASTQGDRFALAQVLFAVSLFVAGTGLVFKTRLRWVFASVGLVFLIGACGYLSRLEWM